MPVIDTTLTVDYKLLKTSTTSTQWQQVYINISGSDLKGGFDQFVFDNLKLHAAQNDKATHTNANFTPVSGTHRVASTGLTSAEAEALWDYTDGYRATVKTIARVNFDSRRATTWNSTISTKGDNNLSMFCFKKNIAGKSTSTAVGYDKSDGSICWSFDAGRLSDLGYWEHADLKVKGDNKIFSTNTVEYQTGSDAFKAQNKWAGQFNINAANGEFLNDNLTGAVTSPKNKFFGITKPAVDTRYNKMRLADEALEFFWYMPKHQEHDFYKNNFRLNKGDTVQLQLAENVDCQKWDLTWVTGLDAPAVELVSGATGLAASAFLAAGAAYLAF